MKKTYESPEMEIIQFEEMDIIVTSDGIDDEPEVEFPDGK